MKMGSALIWNYLKTRTKSDTMTIASVSAKETKRARFLEVAERGAIKIIGTKARAAMGNDIGQ
jgi:hypothetical protein